MSEMASKVFNWVNTRLPIVNTFERHLSKHPVPKKVNFWYLFGALASVVLIIQIVTGIWLIMPYSNLCGGTTRLVGAGTPLYTLPTISNIEP